MTVFHDAYLFRPEVFASTVRPFVEELLAGANGYTLLRAYALELYDSRPHIRHLFDQYGAWDRDALLEMWPEEGPYCSAAVAFGFVVILYSQLERTSANLGLAENWWAMRRALRELGWSDRDTSLLIDGRDFASLAKSHFAALASESQQLEYWEYVRPASTFGQAGWLDAPDIQHLLDILGDDQSRFQQLMIIDGFAPEPVPADTERAHKSAMEMLLTAQRSQTGVCMIKSG